jgi:hypothetical protein
VPLLARDNLVKMIVSALAGFGGRAAGEMVAVLLDPATSDVVRRRLPIALKSCAVDHRAGRPARRARVDGFEIRLRCGRALLALTDEHPDSRSRSPTALALAQRELGGGDRRRRREHVFNLLALALEREPVQIAARAFATDDSYVRGTALEYLETVLPAPLFAAFQPLLTAAGRRPRAGAAGGRARRADQAGATMTVSLDELRRQLDVALGEEPDQRFALNTTPAPPVDDADRILLVDDDPTNLDVLRHTLTAAATGCS